MNEVIRILIERDGMTEVEAESFHAEMVDRVAEGENPEEVLYEIGLEPDYIFDIM